MRVSRGKEVALQSGFLLRATGKGYLLNSLQKSETGENPPKPIAQGTETARDEVPKEKPTFSSLRIMMIYGFI